MLFVLKGLSEGFAVLNLRKSFPTSLVTYLEKAHQINFVYVIIDQMHLELSIVVPQTTKQVWDLFSDPHFLVKWDRGVEQIIPTSQNPAGAVGYTFDTVAPLQKGQKKALRMSYRIIEHIPDYQTKIALENSNMFKEAIWTMRIEPAVNRTLITCLVDLKVKFKYFFMAPILYFNKKAILTDLQYLKQAIAQHYAN